MYLGHGLGWGMGFAWPIGIIVMAIVIYLLIKVFAPSDGRYNHRHTHSSSAMDLLKRRYANGEISKEEFDRIAKDLSHYGEY